jgi:hypothetical protein
MWQHHGLKLNKTTAEKRELFPIYSIPSMHHRLTNYRKQRKLEEVFVVAFNGLKCYETIPFFVAEVVNSSRKENIRAQRDSTPEA